MTANRLALAVVVAVHAVLVWNAWVHDPQVGYDAGDHLLYVETLAQGRLPLPGDTREFFCPPAPYALPALLRALGVSYGWVGKLAQLFNVVCSLALFTLLLGICERLRPGNGRFKLAAVSLLGMLPVYYKSFAQVRGEPLLAFLCVLAVYCALGLFARHRPSLRAAAGLGAIFGGVVLSRQWGVFLLPAVALFALLLVLRRRHTFAAMLRTLLIASVATLLVGGWFYIRHATTFGSATAFNRAPESFSFTNQPRSFYLGLGDGALFSEPVREAFPNQFWPIFYSEVWGDYWSFFCLRQPPFGDLRGGRPIVVSNRDELAGQLGRVNAVSLLPSLLFGIALVSGGVRLLRRPRGPCEMLPAEDGLDLLWLVVVVSLLGYGWFLIRYPILDRGDTVKATYMLQIFPFLAILAAEQLEWLRSRSRSAYAIVGIGLAMVALHNLPVLFTRHFAPLPDLPLRVAERSYRPAPEAPAGRPGGIRADYYAGQAFDRLVLSRVDRQVDLRAGAAPAPGVDADDFSVRWSGQLFFPTQGRHLLCAQSDEGARVRFGAHPLIDDWGPHATRLVCEAVRVEKGWYPLEVEYREGKREAIMRLLRGSDRGNLSRIPAAHLCCRGREDEPPTPGSS